jgi:hypothetical protein
MAKKRSKPVRPAPSLPPPAEVQPPPDTPDQPTGEMGCAGLLVRVYWLVFGNLALFGAALYAAGRPLLSWPGLAFWAIATSLVAVRVVDVKLLDGRTSAGEPATGADLRRYTARVLVASGLLWGIGRLLPVIA